MNEYNGKRVLVVGMVRSGIGATKLLLSRGAIPVINDLKSEDALKGLDEFKGTKAVFELGKPPETLLDSVDMVVISPAVPIQSEWIKKTESMGKPVIGELELGASVANGKLAAITGTNGKTTTTTLLGEMLANAGHVTHVVGNIGNPITLAAIDSRETDIFVAEVSSFQMESAPTFHPEVGALLNITPDHLNRHGDIETYIALKRHMFEKQTVADTHVVNADDAVSLDALKDIKSRRLTFSLKEESAEGAFIKGDEVVLRFEGTERVLLPVNEIRIPGAHNVQNSMAAICMAAVLGVPRPVMRHTLKTFAGVEHRIETVRTVGGVTYINDSKGTNVDSTLRAIEAMKVPTVIILGGYDKHVSFAQLADAMKNSPNMKAAVLIGDTAAQIKDALKLAGYDRITEAGYDFEKAISEAANLCEGSGNVLLSPACASFDMFSDYENRGHEFRRIVEGL